MKWQFPIFSYFLTCSLRNPCFLLFASKQASSEQIWYADKEVLLPFMRHLLLSLFLSPPSLHGSPCPEGTAISCHSWCPDDEAVHVVLPTWEEWLSSLPGSPSPGEKGLRDGKHCQCSGPFSFYSQSPHPPFHNSPLCAWMSYPLEQILTKEALGPCQRVSLACHLFR